MPLGGASLWLRAPAWVDAGELAALAREHGVLIEVGDVFFARPPYPCPYFRLRLSSIAASAHRRRHPGARRRPTTISRRRAATRPRSLAH